MMTITYCPQCREQVSMPHEAAPDTRVRCPLCQAEYTLRDVLDRLPPVLIVLDAASVAARDVPEEYALAVEEDSPAPVVPGVRVQRPADRTLQTRSRAARPRKSVLWEATKVAFGALLAIPLAQLILWYLPGSLQRDPLELGPQVSRYVRWIVPVNLRAPLHAEDDQSLVTRGSRLQPRRGAQEDRLRSPSMISEETADGLPGAASAPGELPGHEPAADGGAPRGFPATDLEPAELEPGSLGQEALEFAEAFADANAANAAWDSGEPPHTAPAGPLYASLARLGQVVATSSTTEQRNWEPLDAFLRDVTRDADKVAAIAQQTPSASSNLAAGEGIVLVGTVQNIGTRGNSQRILLQPHGSESAPVAVIDDSTSRAPWSAGDEFLVVGVAVDESEEEENEFAVRAAFTVPLEPSPGTSSGNSSGTVESARPAEASAAAAGDALQLQVHRE